MLFRSLNFERTVKFAEEYMRRTVLFSTIAHGVSSIGPQLLALVSLSSLDFGKFSIAYLVFALALSVTFSLLCDPWVIVAKEKSWDVKVYPSILSMISVIFASIGTLVLVAILRDVQVAFAGFVGILFATYRAGARHFLVFSGRWMHALGTDLTSIMGLGLGAGLGLILNSDSLSLVLMAWVGASLAGCIFGPLPIWSPSHCSNWFRENRRLIRPLLADSLIMDAESIGTPFILLPLLGVQSFGVYRGISNLSAPIRLLLAPFRTVMISSSSKILSARWLATVFSLAGGIGVVTWIALFSIGYLAIEIGVLTELSKYAVPAAVYVFGAVLVSVFPLIVRAQKKSRLLLLGRGSQTLVLLAGPIAGYIFFGLQGAIWGYAILTIVSGFVWLWASVMAR